MNGVITGGVGLVAVGFYESGNDRDAAVWTSMDGITWSQAPHDDAVFGGDGWQEVRSVTAGGPGLVAVGFDESGGYRDAAVWTSPEGVTWSREIPDQAVLGGVGSRMDSVTSGGPGLVAIGSSFSAVGVAAAVWTSTDGITWSRVPHNEAVLGGDGQPGMSSVTAGGPGLVAVGFDDAGGDMDAAVWTSTDGITWSRVPHDEAVLGGDGSQVMKSVAAGGPGLVAVGRDGARRDTDAAVWTSPDGITWSRVIPDEVVFGGVGRQEMWSVTLGEPGLVAVGFDDGGGDTDAAVWTSPDGITWSRVPHDEAVLGGVDGQFMTGVTAGGPGVVAVGFAESLSAAVWVLAGED